MNNPKSALILVDVQNDFCPGGALGVPDGDRVVEPLNRAAAAFAAAGLPIFATRDWHPPETSHFQPYGGMWPVHCTRNSQGAAFHPKLHLPAGTILLSKGTREDQDGYSAFDGITDAGVTFAEILKKYGIDHLYIGGLATDYCVRFTVLEARERGLTVTVLEDAIAGVDLQPGDSEHALAEMRVTGARMQKVMEIVLQPVADKTR